MLLVIPAKYFLSFPTYDSPCGRGRYSYVRLCWLPGKLAKSVSALRTEHCPPEIRHGDKNVCESIQVTKMHMKSDIVTKMVMRAYKSITFGVFFRDWSSVAVFLIMNSSQP